MISLLGRVALICLVTVLSGCAYYGSIPERAEAFNRDVETTLNDQVLLNIVRTAFRRAPVFTVIQSANAGVRGSLNVATTLFSGLDSSVNPTVLLQDPQPTLTLAAEISKNFNQGISSAVPISVVALLIDQGLPTELVLTVLVESIDLVSRQKDGATATILRCTNLADHTDMNWNCAERYNFPDFLRLMLRLGATTATNTNTTPVGPKMTRSEALAYMSSHAVFGTALREDPKTGLFQIVNVQSSPGINFDKLAVADGAQCECVPKDILELISAPVAGETSTGTISSSSQVEKDSSQSLVAPREFNADRSSAIRATDKRAAVANPICNAGSNCTTWKKLLDEGKLAFNLKLRSTVGAINFLGGIAKLYLRADSENRKDVLDDLPAIYSDNNWPAVGEEISAVCASNSDVEWRRRNCEPKLLFIACPGAPTGPADAVVSLDGIQYWAPGDRGSEGYFVCGSQASPFFDHRTGEAIGLISKLLALNRDSAELAALRQVVVAP